MLIIIEGCDGTGKTTLADVLVERLDARLMHSGPLTGDPFVEYKESIRWYMPGTGAHLICDRWHWGETIYGPLYRGASALDDYGVERIDRFLRARGALVVHTGWPRSVDDLAQRLEIDGEDFLQLRHVETVLTQFGNLAGQSRHVPTITVDVIGRGAEIVADQTIMIARALELEASDYQEYTR